MVKKLLELGADYEVTDAEGMTALDIAKLHANFDVAQTINTHHLNRMKRELGKPKDTSK